MTGKRTYPHGVTCWVDTEQVDLVAAAGFYGGLFGWVLRDAVPRGKPGSYLIATLDGRDAAGIGPAPEGAGTPTWNTYVSVTNADAAAAAVSEAGGTVVTPPADARTAGRRAVCLDPAGTAFRLWQAGDRLGAQIVNTPGAWNFSNLHTADRDRDLPFYAAIFGWVAVDMEQDAGAVLQVPGYGDHLAATVDPDIHERQASAPPGFADVIGGVKVIDQQAKGHWDVVFTVADRDASVATAQRLGGTVLGTADTAWTREATIRDPQGAEFTVSQFAPPGER